MALAAGVLPSEGAEVTELALLVAKCPTCPGWFAIGEPCEESEKGHRLEDLALLRHTHVCCPYCGRSRGFDDVMTRWARVSLEPAE